MQQSKSFSLALTVNPASKAALGAGDIAPLGYFLLTNNVGEGITFGAPLGHWYVNGQLRFLVVAYNNGANDIVEFALPSGGFGQTISTRTNRWPGASVWAFRAAPALQGHHYGFWMEPLAGGGYRMWQSFGIDYPGSPYANMTLGIATCTLNSDGTVSNYKSCWGFQGVSQRCIMGRVQPIPSWFQSKYGTGPYLYGTGGYASLMAQGGTVSLGLFALAGPDATAYPPQAGYPPAGYVNGSGSDWNIPSSAFKILADHRSGTSGTDWYGSGAPTTKDRGVRQNPVTNYYDGGVVNGSAGTATFTQGSTAVSFAAPVTLAAGTWVGPASGATLTGQPYQVLASAISNATAGTLQAAYPSATVTTTCSTCSSPPLAPKSGAQWLSPAPDGLNRWPWGDSYFSTGCWIDGPNKSGLVCILNGSGGKAWYHTPGNALGSDSGVAEIHIFDPADLGAVALGQKNPWNVQPHAIKDITPDLTPHGICTLSHSAESNGPSGATYDATTGILWIFSPHVDPAFGGSGYNCLLSAYQVTS